MNALVWTLFLMTVCLEVAGQTVFKIGTSAFPDALSGLALWKATFLNPWIVGGIVIYFVEASLWLFVLASAPLSAVGPMAALSYVGVGLVGRFLLQERLSQRRWLGIGLVSAGAALIAATL